ncbi:MAG: carboxypeptidase regulatory-like domain-containing protein [Longimicrobiales bacterium]
MSARTLRHRAILILAAACGLAGCEDVLLHDPAPAPAVLGLAFSLTGSSAAGGPAAAYDKADSVHVAVFRASDFIGFEENFGEDLTPINAIHFSSASFTPAAENRIQIEIDLESDAEPLVIVGALSRARQPLFAGTAIVRALRGETTSTDVSLIAIPDELNVASVPTITSLGDTARINAVVLFATGDTIPGLTLNFSSSNPQVATVDLSGRVVARTEGQTQVTVTAAVQFFSLSRVVNVTVTATVNTIDVTPTSATIDVGGFAQFTAVARDRRGNALVRTFTWSSSAPGVASVDPNTGRVTGLTTGAATITARNGTVTRSVNVTVRVSNSVVSGRVTQAVTNTGIAGATVTALSGPTQVTALTDAQGNYTLTVPSNRNYLFSATATGHARQELTQFIEAAQHTINFALSLTHSRIGGLVTNAVTGLPIPNATVAAFNGATLAASASTDLNGRYALSVPTGVTYQVAAVAPNYIRHDANITAVAAEHLLDFVLSPVLAQGQLRVVLTWGADPVDLDSHLFGPISQSVERFHVFYAATGSLTASPFALLDIDDQTSFGPETITIGQTLIGRYTYSVHHFAGASNIAGSGALVRVFQGAQLIAQFTPPNLPGSIWNVFRIDVAPTAGPPIITLTPTQTMGDTYAGSPNESARRVVGLQAELNDAQRKIVEAARLYRKNQHPPR